MHQGKKKQIRKSRRREKEKTTYGLPSLCERSKTPGALDRPNWESLEANPLPYVTMKAAAVNK